MTHTYMEYTTGSQILFLSRRIINKCPPKGDLLNVFATILWTHKIRLEGQQQGLWGCHLRSSASAPGYTATPPWG